MKKVTIGIDIGGTTTKYGIVDMLGEVMFQNAIPTQTHAKFEDYISELTDIIGECLDPKLHNLIGIGIYSL